MAVSAKFKRRLKIYLLVLLFAIVAFTGGIYYLATYRLKNAIQYAVNKASSGKYAFDAEHTMLSIWNKTFTLRQAKLYCLDTINVDKHYDIQVKEIFFSISSIRDLVLNKKILVDSLLIVAPAINLHAHTVIAKENKAGSFQTSAMLNYLQQALKRFNARSLVIKDAAFTYGILNGPQPFHTDHINITFTNFSEIKESDDHILGSDNVTLDMGRQNWIMPDGIHTLSFKGLSFDGKTQRLELDSFSFHRTIESGTRETVIQAKKFFISSHQLPAIYMRNELIIDSMVCIDPVIILPASVNASRKVNDTNAARKYIFDLVKVKYINVQNGDVIVKNKNGQTENASGRKSNLSIYGLTLNPSEKEAVATDSIKLDLSNIVLISKDSLTQLTIGKFSFKNDNVLFQQVVLEPTNYRQTDQGLRFKAPSLLIKNFSLEDLMHKRIKATEAELIRPEFSLVHVKKIAGKTPTQKAASKNKMDMFYQSLHGMQDLIDVPFLKIVDGSAAFSAKGKLPLDMSVGKFNATILLNQLFVSDSLINIKYAMPYINFANNHIKTSGIDVALKSYRFDGTRRQNRGDGLTVKFDNGTLLQATGLYWDVFDWDVFQNTKAIQVDVLKIKKLNIAAVNGQRSTVKNDLPVIRIGSLEIAEADYSMKGNTSLRFNSSNIILSNIRSVKAELNWDHGMADIYNLELQSKNVKAGIKKIEFDNYKESFFKEISFKSENEKNTANLLIPIARIKYDLLSTDISNPSINAAWLDRPEITISSHKNFSTEGHSGIPGKAVTIYVKDFTINKGNVNYTSFSSADTISSGTLADIYINSLNFSSVNPASLQFDTLHLGLKATSYNKKGISLWMPDFSLSMKNGKTNIAEKARQNFSAATELSWKNIDLHYSKANTDISMTNLSGSFKDRQLSLEQGKKVEWGAFVNKTTVGGANISYRGKKINAGAKNFSWDPDINQFMIAGFSIDPVISREETFHSDKWQKDYINIKGDTILISGINLRDKKIDSLISVRRIFISRADLVASRDKNIPFQHGIEKPMPTRLIQRIPVPLIVDTVIIRSSDVTYNERAVSTKLWSCIPLKNVNGYLLNITNRGAASDSLFVHATAGLLDNQIRHFYYTESYDSLSGFRAQSNMAPILLTSFSEVSMPMAAVSIENGLADTMYAFWEGNRHAAYGGMNFYYHHLKIRIHDKNNVNKRSFKSSLLTFAANLILPNQKMKPSVIFIERDKEKFIFNYWVKTHTSGLLSTVGIKRNSKYRKLFLKKQTQFSLSVKQKVDR